MIYAQFSFYTLKPSIFIFFKNLSDASIGINLYLIDGYNIFF